jgi:DNA-binding MarR family transcriptional regulator
MGMGSPCVGGGTARGEVGSVSRPAASPPELVVVESIPLASNPQERFPRDGYTHPVRDSVSLMIEEWRRSLPELDIDGMAVVKRIVRLDQELALVGGEALSEFGLEVGEFDVLATLLRAGTPYRLTPTALFRSLLVSSSGMTKRIDRLEERALVRRVDDPADRRSRLVELTDGGQALARDAVVAHTEACAGALAGLPGADLVRLGGLLGRALAQVEARRAGPAAG